ncbi:hypothetical protein [Dethiothermospora halolimnae]|uniref:hypothetical protein n=1 Tax=Dethiothermospora halolimnae TaxID=3114390 RepID=UPI003CCC0059
MKKKLIIIPSIFIFILIFFFSPLYPMVKSYGIMYPYSFKHKTDSILYKKDIDLNIKGGLYTEKKDWYPFVMTYTASDDFSKYTGRDFDLTVLYNFGHFKLKDEASSFYDPTSPYFSSFYGGYVIQNKKNPNDKFGFLENGDLDINDISNLTEFDQNYLVLSSIGCPKEERIFEIDAVNIIEDVDYMKLSGWTKVNANIKTNSPMHKFRDDQRGYIQYGKPISRFYDGKDFPVIDLKGRIYAKYIDEYKITVVMFIVSPSLDTINECDDEILSHSTINN